MGWKAKRGNSAAGYHRECYSKFTNKTSIERAIIQSGKAQLVLRPVAEGGGGLGGSAPPLGNQIEIMPPLIPHFLPFKKIDNAAVISKPTKSTKA